MTAVVYFDGRTSRGQPVLLLMHNGVVVFSGDGFRRSVNLAQLTISERLAHAPRILSLPDGGFIEINGSDFDQLLVANGYREPRVVRWQQNWQLSLLALILVLGALIAGYQWGLPWAADSLARHLPASVEKKIGDEQLKMLDAAYLQPSKLDAARQTRLRHAFAGLKQPRNEKTAYRLEFRDSRIGPNAFALPNGVIVMTDQLVTLASDEQAILAVLAHELGHVQRRHSLRRLLQALGVGAAVNLLVGDISGVLAAAPAFMLDQKYSRDFEREADQYAIDMMRANRIALSPMADLFEKMGTLRDGRDAVAADEPAQDGKHSTRHPGKQHASPLEYFSSHPSDHERIARLRASDVQQ